MALDADRTPLVYGIVTFDREDGGSAYLSTYADPGLALASYEAACKCLYDISTEEFVAIYADGTSASVAVASEFGEVDAAVAVAKVRQFLGR